MAAVALVFLLWCDFWIISKFMGCVGGGTAVAATRSGRGGVGADCGPIIMCFTAQMNDVVVAGAG